MERKTLSYLLSALWGIALFTVGAHALLLTMATPGLWLLFGLLAFLAAVIVLSHAHSLRTELSAGDHGPADTGPADPSLWLTRCALAAKDGSGNRCYLEIGHKGVHKYGALADIPASSA